MSVAYGPYWDMRGLSSDEKPLDVSDGSKFTETNTGNEYLFDASNGTWYLQPVSSTGGGAVTAGVASFNGRSGAVMPMADDYTAAMVGADAAGSAADALTAAKTYTDNALDGFTVTAEFTQAVDDAVQESLQNSVTTADPNAIDALFP